MAGVMSSVGVVGHWLIILLLILGSITLAAIVATFVVLIISSRRREKVKARWLEYETLKAARRLHHLTSGAFQDMLDEARSHGQEGRP